MPKLTYDPWCNHHQVHYNTDMPDQRQRPRLPDKKKIISKEERLAMVETWIVGHIIKNTVSVEVQKARAIVDELNVSVNLTYRLPPVASLGKPILDIMGPMTSDEQVSSYSR